ncbi:unnamed protein product [Calypogeia fissa]
MDELSRPLGVRNSGRVVAADSGALLKVSEKLDDVDEPPLQQQSHTVGMDITAVGRTPATLSRVKARAPFFAFELPFDLLWTLDSGELRHTENHPLQ